MSSCLDAFPFLAQVDWENKRNSMASVGAGILYFGALWLMIDTSVTYTPINHFSNVYFLLTVFGTIAMFMINAVSNNQVSGTSMDEGVLGTKGARFWMMTAFFFAFATLIAAVWILFSVYVLVEGDIPNWPGLAIFFHSFFIFLATLLYKFGRTEDLYG